MKRFPFLLLGLVAAGGSAGFLVGHASAEKKVPAEAADQSPRAASRRERETERPARTLGGLASVPGDPDGLPAGFASAISRASSGRLRDQLAAVGAQAPAGSRYGIHGLRWRSAMDAMAAELFRRERQAALAWAEGAGDPAVTAAMLRAVATEDPVLLKAVMSRQPAERDWEDLDEIIRAAFAGAANRGAQALLEVERLQLGMPPHWLRLTYPEAFDFATYVTRTESDAGREKAFGAWAARDPDAAAAKLAERVVARRKGHSFRDAAAAVIGAADIQGNAAAVAWTSDWLAGLPEEIRAEACKDLAKSELREDLAVSLVAGLATSADRVTLAAAALGGPWFKGGELLQALPDVSARSAAIRQWRQAHPHALQGRMSLAAELRKSSLPEAEKGVLLDALMGN